MASFAAESCAESAQTVLQPLFTSRRFSSSWPSWRAASVALLRRTRRHFLSIETWLLQPCFISQRPPPPSPDFPPPSLFRILTRLIVQRASTSFRLAFSGLSRICEALSPFFARAFSSSVILRRGTETTVASAICPFPGSLALRAELLLVVLEELLESAGVRLLLPEQPDRFLVRYRLAELEAEEAQPAEPVENHALDPFVAQVVHGSQDQDLEHRDGIAGRTPAFRSVAAVERGLQSGAEDLEVDVPLDELQRIA